MKSFLQFLLFVLLITLALAGLYAWKSGGFEEWGGAIGVQKARATKQVQAALTTGDVPNLLAMDAEYSKVANAVLPSVVSITARRLATEDPREELMRRFFGTTESMAVEEVPQGSGAIVSEDGYIVTNLHVLKDAGEILVALQDGRQLPAKILGADPLSDIAVLKVDATGLRPLVFADSEGVRVGQLVFAVGSPFGLQETVTHGIISARERLFSSESVNEFFQTDAAINRGNSGGPLVNILGELVGLNNFILTESGGSQGLGFSIPANSVRRVFDQILEHGRVLRPYLGVQTGREATPGVQGATIEKVLPHSPAEEAGLLPGDVITKFDGKEIRDFNALRKRVADAKIEEDVLVEVTRDGKEMLLPVKLVELQRPDVTIPLPLPPTGGLTPAVVPDVVTQGEAAHVLTGVEVSELTPDLIRLHRLPENASGVIVRSVAMDSAADGILQSGDMIESVNNIPTPTVDAFLKISKALGGDESVILLFERGKVRSFEIITP